MATHPHSALHIYQFITVLHQTCPNKETFDAILLSLQTPRFVSVLTIYERWAPVFMTDMPALLQDFKQLIEGANRSPDYDSLLMRVSEHYYLIYRVSCFLENDLQVELFVRCLCLDTSTPVSIQEVKQTLKQFLNELPPDAREYVEQILIEDHHGYLTREDTVAASSTYHAMSDGEGGLPVFLELDRVYELVNDPKVFDELMAIIQTNTTRDVPWSQTLQEIHQLVAGRNIWLQLAPLLQPHIERDYTDYDSYEDFVQKQFLDNGGKEYLDSEIDRAQVEHMFGNLKM